MLTLQVDLQGAELEAWMVDLEHEMRASLFLVVKNAVASVKGVGEERRLFDWPVEAVMLAHEVAFASETELALRR